MVATPESIVDAGVPTFVSSDDVVSGGDGGGKGGEEEEEYTVESHVIGRDTDKLNGNKA